MLFRVKRLVPEAVVPSRGGFGSAGLDLYCLNSIDLYPGCFANVGTGLAIEFPIGYVADIRPRSSLSSQQVHCYLGTIDSDYRGELRYFLHNLGEELRHFPAGSRLAQLVLLETPEHVEIEEVEQLSSSERGERGFGSTGQ